jgi:protein-S-isoprenylcysteine O-methyltransferase Ste14
MRQLNVSRLAIAWAGAALFAASLLWFLYCYEIRFDRRLDDRLSASTPIAVNVLLFSIFALHHSVLARPGIKRRVQQLVPPALERSLYTWTASVLFIAVCSWWQPVPGELYRLEGVWRIAGYAIQLIGLVLTVRASSKLDVLDLSGVRQVLREGAHVESTRHVPLETTGLYGFVRHPLYFAWACFVFGAPEMTATRAVFAIVSTGYLAIAIPFEERGLTHVFGAEYDAYRRKVRWRMIPGIY